MKSTSAIYALTSTLLFACAVQAQVNSPPQPPVPPSAPAASVSSAAPSTGHQTTIPSPRGDVTIISTPTPLPSAGPPPDFAQLAQGSRYITREQASAYPPLANDFEFADKRHDGKITRDEYERWAQQ